MLALCAVEFLRLLSCVQSEGPVVCFAGAISGDCVCGGPDHYGHGTFSTLTRVLQSVLAVLLSFSGRTW